jgi:hypothetical protein
MCDVINLEKWKRTRRGSAKTNRRVRTPGREHPEFVSIGAVSKELLDRLR